MNAVLARSACDSNSFILVTCLFRIISLCIFRTLIDKYSAMVTLQEAISSDISLLAPMFSLSNLSLWYVWLRIGFHANLDLTTHVTSVLLIKKGIPAN